MKNKLLFIIVVIAISTASISIIKTFNNIHVVYSTSKVKIIDMNTKEQIESATIIITDLEKEYSINKNSNKIYLPKKPYECYSTDKCKDKGLYPYGYTTITFADGYIPRIDHNLILGYESTQVVIELLKIDDENVENRQYEEYFHKHSPSIVYELLNHYKIRL